MYLPFYIISGAKIIFLTRPTFRNSLGFEKMDTPQKVSIFVALIASEKSTIVLQSVFVRMLEIRIVAIVSFSVWETANVWIQEFPVIRAEERAISFLKQAELVIEDQLTGEQK